MGLGQWEVVELHLQKKMTQTHGWDFFLSCNQIRVLLSHPKIHLGSCSTLPGKQDVDIISFPVINPTVAVEWKKPSWQHQALSFWKDPVSDFSPFILSPSKLQVGGPRGLGLHFFNTLPSSPSLFEAMRWRKRHLELKKDGSEHDF